MVKLPIGPTFLPRSARTLTWTSVPAGASGLETTTYADIASGAISSGIVGTPLRRSSSHPARAASSERRVRARMMGTGRKESGNSYGMRHLDGGAKQVGEIGGADLARRERQCAGRCRRGCSERDAEQLDAAGEAGHAGHGER